MTILQEQKLEKENMNNGAVKDDLGAQIMLTAVPSIFYR